MKITTTSLVLSAVLLMTTLFGCSNGPDAVAKKFLAAQEKRDFKTMKELSTKESEQMIGMIEGLSGKDTSKPKAGAPMTVKSTEIKDSTALLTYCCDAEGKDGKLHLKKTAEGWKVDMSKETLMGGKSLTDFMSTDSLKNMSSGTDVDSAGNPIPADTTHK